jgi:hypothetical protein
VPCERGVERDERPQNGGAVDSTADVIFDPRPNRRLPKEAFARGMRTIDQRDQRIAKWASEPIRDRNAEPALAGVNRRGR